VTTPVTSILLVFAAAFVGSCAAVFLKLGAAHVHRDVRTMFFNWRLAAGVALYLLSSVFYLLGIRKGELTILYPMVSLGYFFTLIWSRVYFNEPFTRNKFLGLGLIGLGIVFLSVGRH